MKLIWVFWKAETQQQHDKQMQCNISFFIKHKANTPLCRLFNPNVIHLLIQMFIPEFHSTLLQWKLAVKTRQKI